MRVAFITVAMAAGVLGSLVSRQGTGTFASGDFGACDSSCLPGATALDSCDPPSATCICTADIAAGLKACGDCTAATPGDIADAAQALIAIFASSCADSGIPIPTVSGGTGTGTATGGANSTATATGTGTTKPTTTGAKTTAGGITTTPRSTGTTTTSAAATSTTNAAVSGKGALGVLALVAPLVVAVVAL